MWWVCGESGSLANIANGNRCVAEWTGILEQSIVSWSLHGEGCNLQRSNLKHHEHGKRRAVGLAAELLGDHSFAKGATCTMEPSVCYMWRTKAARLTCITGDTVLADAAWHKRRRHPHRRLPHDNAVRFATSPATASPTSAATSGGRVVLCEGDIDAHWNNNTQAARRRSS
jgi:hypothetical protein